MARYLIRRVISWTVMVFLATNITYFLANLFLDPRANFVGRRPPIPMERVEKMLSPLNLNPAEPLMQRWWRWLTGILTKWDWGKTPIGTNINDEIGFRILTSAQLLLLATILGVVIGVALGVYAAARQYSKADRFLQGISIIALNTHIVVASLIVVLIAIRINDLAGERIFYVTGSASIGSMGFWETLVDAAQHLILPTTALTLIGYCGYFFTQRSLLLDNINADYVRTARAKGLQRTVAIRKHALRTSMIPIAISVAFSIPGIFTGAVLTEKIFAWNGMGSYFITALAKNDVNAVVAVSAFGAVMTAIGAILADLVIVYLDPRVRVS